MKDAVSLKHFIMELTQNEAMQPDNGVTHCNQAARLAAQFYRCNEFDDKSLLADDMIKIMDENKSGNWLVCDGYNATKFAMDGCLVFAAKTSKELDAKHGHIAIIIPLPMLHSGSLNRLVPQIGNVGSRNGVMKVTEAFPVAKGEPRYFKYS